MSSADPIAVVGLGGLFPGAADLDAFWESIAAGRSMAREVPPDRWPVPPDDLLASQPGQPDTAYGLRGCYLDPESLAPDWDSLDIDARLAARLDPLVHLVLQVGLDAWRDTDSAESLDRSRVGVVLANIALPTDTSSRLSRGVLGRSFEEAVLGDGAPVASDAGLGTEPLNRYVTALPAGMLARALGLGGGSYTLDAACASSLYAVHLAVEELRAGRLDAVLAGGVSRPECLYTQVGFSQLTALSPTGRCAPFDQSADGLVVGEGGGVFVLRRLADAVAAGDRIRGVIHSVGWSNDVGGSLLAPSSEGQCRAIRQAYERAGWDPSTVDLVECHGTGTPTGDAVELASLTESWESASDRSQACVLGSVKSNVGHLLTGAGAAGLMKVLFSLKNRTLPPTASFESAIPGLEDSPFTVLSEAKPWDAPVGSRPRRAAVSAFGFGGINAHLLVEEWVSESAADKATCSVDGSPPATEPVAIVGMGAHFGRLEGLQAFQRAVLRGETAAESRPAGRWQSAERGQWMERAGLTHSEMKGAWIERLSIPVGRYRLPPNEIPGVLAQQLLMLEVAREATRDTQAPWKCSGDGGSEAPQLRSGVVVGLGLDLESTSFHLGWVLRHQVRQWAELLDIQLTDEEEVAWVAELKGALGPELDANRTLGALGGIVASRIARELRLGGPSFVVSGEEASGLRALEVAVRMLQRDEVDSMLVGAVDLAGDVRSVLATGAVRPWSASGVARPFDHRADGALVGEGAAAVVLKRLSDAQRDGDRIYAVVSGLGAAHGGGGDALGSTADSYRRAVERACQDAGVPVSSLGLIEAHGSGHPGQDGIEAEALVSLFSGESVPSCGISSARGVVGDAGAAGALASVVKAALCVFHGIRAPLAGYEAPCASLREMPSSLFALQEPRSWLRDRSRGPRRAGVSAISTDGNCTHAVLEEAPMDVAEHRAERSAPLGSRGAAVFLVTGDDAHAVEASREALRQQLRSAPTLDIETHARRWYGRSVSARETDAQRSPAQCCQAFVARSAGELVDKLGAAGEPKEHLAGELAFVFPGSGNHYVGMGANLGLAFPEVMRRLDQETESLLSQLVPAWYAPWRLDWSPGWQSEAQEDLESAPERLIFGQVAHGITVATVLQELGLRPQAVIGYSLGESAGLFALRAWRDRDGMFRRTVDSPLFTHQLAGECQVAARAWGVEQADWSAVVVNRAADLVRSKLVGTAALLIVNAPSECVLGGRAGDVRATVEALDCEAFPLTGVPTVHCGLVDAVADDYRALHVQPTTPPAGVRFYSGAKAASYIPDPDTAAASILANATAGFDFEATVLQAWEDGVRVFVEAGPQASCTRMIGRILGDRPHLAISACQRGEDDLFSVLRVVARVAELGVPVDLSVLYGADSGGQGVMEESSDASRVVDVVLGGERPVAPTMRQLAERRTPVTAPSPVAGAPRVAAAVAPEPMEARDNGADSLPVAAPPAAAAPPIAPEASVSTSAPADLSALVSDQLGIAEATARAHAQFLEFSQRSVALQEAGILTLAEAGVAVWDTEPASPLPHERFVPTAASTVAPAPVPAFDRDLCMEFAVGSIGRMLGPMFAEVDSYPTRVRLPDEPLMLVDRIVSVEGEPGSMTSGRVVTEHDVLPGAWYLNGGRAPVCISVEAGQADLFLSAYLGIDLETHGERVYRLLDAAVTFYRDLPAPGETVRYDIHIDRFIRQGSTWLFFFRFEGWIGSEHLITMEDGCAGFFSHDQLASGRGIVDEEFGEPDTRRVGSDGQPAATFEALVPLEGAGPLDEEAMDCLRVGDLEGAFGPTFRGRTLAPALRLPGERMRLIHRITQLDPLGGRYGLGLVEGETDVDPQAWYLTCHFVDDRVMPGALMYEGCLHTLRVLLTRLGWVVDEGQQVVDLHLSPIENTRSKLRCRGQVIESTRRVTYRIEIKELGYDPSPYVLADAVMFADDRKVVTFRNVSLQMRGADRRLLEGSRRGAPEVLEAQGSEAAVRYDRDSIMAFAIGKPSEAFGARYLPFDQERRIARLPGPPYAFMDRVTRVDAEPWVLEPTDWIEAEYDVPVDAWYFAASRQRSMPFAVLLEVALQPCGWLAAYLGSALRSEEDLHFRNLEGKAVWHREVGPESGTLRVRVRLTGSSEAGGMILQSFDMQVLDEQGLLYEGDTKFGFFPTQSLKEQVGLRGARDRMWQPRATTGGYELPRLGPATPDDARAEGLPERGGLERPAVAWAMLDRIDCWLPEGGPQGLGWISGSKDVNPDEWFFAAHFYQDPVMPGSLGLESFLELLKTVATDRWGADIGSTHRFEPFAMGEPHEWVYRGQVIPTDHRVTVQAAITEIRDGDEPLLRADGFLEVDGRVIYEMKSFALRLVPLPRSGGAG